MIYDLVTTFMLAIYQGYSATNAVDFQHSVIVTYCNYNQLEPYLRVSFNL